MDGLIIVGRSGQPIALSRFRHARPAYPQVHADHLRDTLLRVQPAGATEPSDKSSRRWRSERDVPPVLTVPFAAELMSQSDDSDADDDTSTSDDEDSEPALAVEVQEWQDASHRNPRAPTAEDEGEAAREGGAALCHIKVGELRFLCPVSRDAVPLAFLHKVVSVLQDYLVGSTDPALLTEELVCEHFDIVYELLEEMLDGEGNVLMTEVNSLKDIVLPPSWLDKLVKTVGLNSPSERARTSLASPIPWRRPPTKHTKNEVYLDLIEELEGMVHSDGTPVTLDLRGRLVCSAQLSGTPELVVTWNTPSLIEHAAWHPCIRQRTWTDSRKLCFVPPDGTADLGTYALKSGASALGRSSLADKTTTLPLSMQVDLQPHEAARGGRPFEIRLTTNLPSTHTITDVTVEWMLGDGVHGVDASPQLQGIATRHAAASDIGTLPHAANAAGSVVFDRKHQLLRWTLGSMPQASAPVLGGTILAAATCRPAYALQTHLSVVGYSISGLRVSSIQLQQENYVPIKGVRPLLSASLEFRRP